LYCCWFVCVIKKGQIVGLKSIRIIGFFHENRLHWWFEVGKKYLQTAVLGYMFIYVEIKY